MVTIDEMFVGSLPQDIKDNARRLNQGKKLKVSSDHNSFKLVLKRIKSLIAQKFGVGNKVTPAVLYSEKHNCTDQKKLKKLLKVEIPGLVEEFINLIVNIWHIFI